MVIFVQKDTFLYKKIYNEIKKRIDSYYYPPTTQLPLESELQAEFGVSAITVKKALSMLTNEHLLNRIPGKGTFVCSEENLHQLSGDRTIGLILEHVTSPFGLEMMYQIDKFSAKYGYRTRICFSYGHSEKESEDISYLVDQNVSGLIIMPCHSKHYNSEILKLVLDGFPMVFIYKSFHGIPISSVQTDNKLAAQILVEEHIKKGCKSLAFIMVDRKGATYITERKSSFEQKTHELGINAIVREIQTEDNFLEPKPNKKRVSELLEFLQSEGENIDGIICAEYGIVIDLTEAIRQWKSPHKNKIIISSVDEDHLSANGYSYMHVKQDEKAIAETAVNVLMKKIRNDIDVKDCYRIPPIFFDV